MVATGVARQDAVPSAAGRAARRPTGRTGRPRMAVAVPDRRAARLPGPGGAGLGSGLDRWPPGGHRHVRLRGPGPDHLVAPVAAVRPRPRARPLLLGLPVRPRRRQPPRQHQRAAALVRPGPGHAPVRPGRLPQRGGDGGPGPERLVRLRRPAAVHHPARPGLRRRPALRVQPLRADRQFRRAPAIRGAGVPAAALHRAPRDGGASPVVDPAVGDEPRRAAGRSVPDRDRDAGPDAAGGGHRARGPGAGQPVDGPGWRSTTRGGRSGTGSGSHWWCWHGRSGS